MILINPKLLFFVWTSLDGAFTNTPYKAIDSRQPILDLTSSESVWERERGASQSKQQ